MVDVQGSSGQLFSITDSLTGSLFSVNTVAGLPVVEAFSDNTVNIGKFGIYPIKVVATGSLASITGSFTGSFVGSVSGTATSASYALTASFVNPLTQSVNISGLLHISGAAATALFRVSNPASADFTIQSDSTLTDYTGLYWGNDYKFVSKQSATLFINTANNISFANGFATKTTMNSSGQLGVGVSSAASILATAHVRGSGTTSATTALLVQNVNASSSLAVLDNGKVGIGTVTPSASLHIVGQTTSSLSSSFVVQNSNLSSSLVVLDNRNVGIGTVTPSTKLEVVGDVNVGAILNIGGATGNAGELNFFNSIVRIIRTSTSDLNYFTTGGQPVMAMTSTNRVGIGITTPSSSLHVVGNTILSGSFSTSSAALLIYKSGSTTLDIQGSQGQLFSVVDNLSGSLMSVNDVSGLPILEVFSDDRVVMGTYGTPAMVITGSNTIISGSLRGRVVILSTGSATASMDCSLSNFFDLTLSSSMYLTPVNIQPGETINLRITQPATSGSLNYSSSIKFPNGLPYTASATASVVDLISFISFDSSTLYATALKNLV